MADTQKYVKKNDRRRKILSENLFNGVLNIFHRSGPRAPIFIRTRYTLHTPDLILSEGLDATVELSLVVCTVYTTGPGDDERHLGARRI